MGGDVDSGLRSAVEDDDNLLVAEVVLVRTLEGITYVWFWW